MDTLYTGHVPEPRRVKRSNGEWVWAYWKTEPSLFSGGPGGPTGSLFWKYMAFSINRKNLDEVETSGIHAGIPYYGVVIELLDRGVTLCASAEDIRKFTVDGYPTNQAFDENKKELKYYLHISRWTVYKGDVQWLEKFRKDLSGGYLSEDIVRQIAATDRAKLPASSKEIEHQF